MPGTFAYDEATNTVEVTDGTSGAPTTFNDMYTADQAGTATILLSAEAGASGPGNSLVYPIRPTHDKALIIKCIVAGKTAEADFIFITGTDAWGVAQTESLDVTAGNGTYTTTKRFATATEFDCSDNAAGGGVQWADGTIQITQDIWGVVWEFVADGLYKIDAEVDFGDGSTSTYFTSDAELVYWTTNVEWRVRAQATLKLHRSGWNTWVDGENWGAAWNWNSNGVLTASLMNWRSSNGCSSSMYGITLENCIMCDVSTINFPNVGIVWMDSANDIKNLYVHGLSWGAWFNQNVAVDGFIAEDCKWSVYTNANVDVSIKGLEFINSVSADVRISTAAGQTLTLKDSVTGPSTINLVHASDALVEQYTCNIHITDKDGADLQNVDVDCKYAHLVEGSDSKTYKCIQDHTSVDATHKPITGSDWASFWELYDAAGGLGGDWQTTFDFKTAAEEFVTKTTNVDGDLVGDELVTNGNFAVGTGWTMDGTWAIAGDVASCDGGQGANQFIQQNLTPRAVVGRKYKIDYEVTANTLVGATYLVMSSASCWNSFNCLGTVGTHSYYKEAVRTGDLDFRLAVITSSTGGSISIDNISVREIGTVIQYKKWVGTSELLEARIHKFTFSHADYPNFVMNDAIVDHPLVWELDMGQSTSDLQTIVAGELATYDPPTRAELTTDKAAIIAEVDANETKIDAISTVVPDAAGTAAALLSIIQGADNDTLETLSDQIDGVATLGVGATPVTYTVLDGDTNPIDGVAVWVTTDETGDNVIASGTTNDSGEITFMLDSGTTYYMWSQKAGYNFTNPDTEVVP